MHSGTGPGYVEKATEAAVAKATEELKAVLTCQGQVEGRTIILRFVKREDVDSRADYNDISSTIVRNIMSTKGDRLETLNWMALSAQVLWQYKDCWDDKARLGKESCIRLQQSAEELQIPEKPKPFEQPPPLEEPPSSDGLPPLQKPERETKVPPSIEDLPAFESFAPREISHSCEEPQSLEQPEKS